MRTIKEEKERKRKREREKIKWNSSVNMKRYERLVKVNYLKERYKETNDRKSKLVSNDMLLNALKCFDNEMLLLLLADDEEIVSH